MLKNSSTAIRATFLLRATSCSTARALQRGFTLIELLVVIAIIAILATLAIPSFVGLIANTSISRAINGFVSDTRYARGEGMRRGKNVTICRSSNPLVATPVCSGGDGTAVGGWMEGWVVFVDEDGDGVFDNAIDTVLRVQEPVRGIGDFFAVGAATTSAVATGNRIIYDAMGRAIGQQGRWLVHASGSLSGDATYARTLCMNAVGRVRVVQGESAC
ncbi:MAG: GspH/FimT family pseudopilin [Rhodoferax sp.]|nr:GspH/FimT family pseudopilin [Rhodoferax sp.]